jgi:hypothetical protein
VKGICQQEKRCKCAGDAGKPQSTSSTGREGSPPRTDCTSVRFLNSPPYP